MHQHERIFKDLLKPSRHILDWVPLFRHFNFWFEDNRNEM